MSDAPQGDEQALKNASRPIISCVAQEEALAPLLREVARYLLRSSRCWPPDWKAYHIFVLPEKGDISHTEALYLVVRHGYERSGYLYPFLPSFVSRDLTTLASERRG